MTKAVSKIGQIQEFMYEVIKQSITEEFLEIMGLLSGSGFTKVVLISEPYKER